MRCESDHIYEQRCDSDLPLIPGDGGSGNEDLGETLLTIKWIPHYRRAEWDAAGRPNWWQELHICEGCYEALLDSFENDSDENYYDIY